MVKSGDFCKLLIYVELNDESESFHNPQRYYEYWNEVDVHTNI